MSNMYVAFRFKTPYPHSMHAPMAWLVGSGDCYWPCDLTEKEEEEMIESCVEPLTGIYEWKLYQGSVLRKNISLSEAKSKVLVDKKNTFVGNATTADDEIQPKRKVRLSAKARDLLHPAYWDEEEENVENNFRLSAAPPFPAYKREKTVQNSGNQKSMDTLTTRENYKKILFSPEINFADCPENKYNNESPEIVSQQIEFSTSRSTVFGDMSPSTRNGGHSSTDRGIGLTSTPIRKKSRSSKKASSSSRSPVFEDRSPIMCRELSPTATGIGLTSSPKEARNSPCVREAEKLKNDSFVQTWKKSLLKHTKALALATFATTTAAKMLMKEIFSQDMLKNICYAGNKTSGEKKVAVKNGSVYSTLIVVLKHMGHKDTAKIEKGLKDAMFKANNDVTKESRKTKIELLL